MQISVRGLVVVGAIGAVAAVLLILGAPLLAGAEPQTGKLTHSSLGATLKELGVEPKLEQQRYDFEFKAPYGEEKWNLSMSAVLSKNGDSVWVMAWLDELPKSAAEVPRTALLRLLANNDIMGKGKFFAYVAGNRRFVLQRVVPNHNLSTEALGDVLLDLGGTVVHTYGHWSVANWSKPSTKGPAQNAKGVAPTTRSQKSVRQTAGTKGARR